MRLAAVFTITRVVLGGLCVAAVVSRTGSSISASVDQGRRLLVTKNCADYTGAAGGWCTITTSNVGQIPPGTKVLYSQAAGVPAGLLDSNVVLDAGDGNKAVGRCTLDFATSLGLCTFSDGTGQLAGFQARADVSFAGGRDWNWEGVYTFNRGGD